MKKIAVGSIIMCCVVGGCVCARVNDIDNHKATDAGGSIGGAKIDLKSNTGQERVVLSETTSRFNDITKGSNVPENMIEIEGNYCPSVRQDCKKWIDDLRCSEFKKPSICLSKERVHMHFLIDKFEWPNKEGSYPEIGFNWYGATERCESVGKRLCSEAEWNFSCEGEEMLPYAYGYKRDNSVCNVDKPWIDYTKFSQDEWNKLYQGVVSDSNSLCKSWAGVINLNGNVDEIINAPYGNAYKNELTGGWWGPIRGRCRPKTTAHSEVFGFYQLGTRCCKNIGK